MSVTLVGEQEVPEPQMEAPRSPAPQGPKMPDFTGIINVIRVGLAVLNARFLLLLALIGAFYLSNEAVTAPEPWRIGAVLLYYLCIVLPMVWLSART